MNGKDIFLGLRYVEEEFIEEAEFGKFSEKTSRKSRTLRRPFLLAAIIALMLLLVGCAVAYVMHMQDMKVGDFEMTTPVFDEDMEFQGYETISQQVLTLAGLKGTPSYRAAQEWFVFTENYDPGDAKWNDYQNFPEEYHEYGAYTQEMVDKIHEIAEKYGLKLIGASVPVHSGKRFYQEMGIDSLLVPGCQAKIQIEGKGANESGCFMVSSFWMEMPEEKGQWPYRMLNSLYFNKKDVFSPVTMTVGDTADWTEWNYTTASGYEVLLTRNGGLGWIICDREDALISIRVLSDEEEEMTKRQFEMVADAFDFSIQPQYQGVVTAMEGVDPKNPLQTQNGFTMELKSAVSDGQRTIITLGITAPENVSLTRLGIAGYEDKRPSLGFASGSFEPKTGEHEVGWSSGTWYTEDDGDGKENTINLVMEELQECDGELAFTPGSEWTLYLEDLQATYWSYESTQMESAWLVEGNWIFDISFTNGDYREIEMIREPVTTNVVVGWNNEGDVYDNVTIKSFILRSLSATVTFEGQSGDLTDYKNEKYVTVMMKDGAAIRLMEKNGIAFDAEVPIDLDEVDHILLADGTKLEIPQ